MLGDDDEHDVEEGDKRVGIMERMKSVLMDDEPEGTKMDEPLHINISIY